MLEVFHCRTLALLVWVCIGSKISEGAIFPCSNHSEFRNQTQSASLNGSARFTFCALSTDSIHSRFILSIPNHRAEWYPKPLTVGEKITPRIVLHNRKGTVTIEVNNLQPDDFNQTFSLILFSYRNGTRLEDNTTIFFLIEETDNQSTTFTTPRMPSTLTQLSYCGTSGNTCSVTDDLCVTVFEGIQNMTYEDQCASHNASSIPIFNITIIKRCLTDLLRLNSVKTLRVDQTRYVETQNWTEVSSTWPYLVVCRIGTQPLDFLTTTLQSPRSKNVSHTQTDTSAAFAVWVTVGTVADGLVIIAVVLVCAFFRKKGGGHFDVARRRDTSDNDHHEEVVIDNMALYNISKMKVINDNMALYNVVENEVVIDNTALYEMGNSKENSPRDRRERHSQEVAHNIYSLAYSNVETSVNETDNINPYEDVKENTGSYEGTIVTSQQQGFSERPRAHGDTARSQRIQSCERTNVGNTSTTVVKVNKSGNEEANYDTH